MQAAAPRVAVVGHVEWVQFARVEHVPAAGEVVHASDPFEEPAGGGAVAAVQLARLAGAATLITALGDDEPGRRSRERLAELGVEVHAATVELPTRRAVTLLDQRGERTIMTLGRRAGPARRAGRERVRGCRRRASTGSTSPPADPRRCAQRARPRGS